MARQKATQLTAGQPAPPPATVAQYREALSDIDRGDLRAAAAGLSAALARAPRNAQFRGDLAYVYASGAHYDEAATEFQRAFQTLQGDVWYLVGLAATRAAQRQFVDAAGTIQLAASNDSAVVDSVVGPAAASWFEQAGDPLGRDHLVPAGDPPVTQRCEQLAPAGDQSAGPQRFVA